MSTDLTSGQPCYEARLLGCTCAWLRGFGVGDPPEEWAEVILARDDECSVHVLGVDA